MKSTQTLWWMTLVKLSFSSFLLFRTNYSRVHLRGIGDINKTIEHTWRVREKGLSPTAFPIALMYTSIYNSIHITYKKKTWKIAYTIVININNLSVPYLFMKKINKTQFGDPNSCEIQRRKIGDNFQNY